MMGKVVRNDAAPATVRPWAPAEIFPEGGKITDTLKSRHVFGAPYKRSTKFFAFFFRDVLD